MDPEALRSASDANLVVAIGRFRAEALEEVYRRHAGAAFGLAQRILNDRSLAEEIVQEVFLRLWNDPARSVRHVAPYPWTTTSNARCGSSRWASTCAARSRR